MDIRNRCSALAGALIATLLCMPTASWAAFVYDESVDGDLSNDGLNPTVLTAGSGANSLSGSTIAGDLDYFTFNVADGLTLDSIILVEFNTSDDLAFMAVLSGPVFDVPPDITDPSPLLGWVHISEFLVGTDILDDLGNGSGAIGFTPPLPSGDYSFWIQQTGDEQVDYSLQFNVSGAAVPVPAALYLFGSGLLTLGGYVRARSRNRAA
jgi:hypothetical protein